MGSEVLGAAVAALGIVVFEQRPDGSFASIAPVPDWFRAFGQDATFPFLGSFLDEARAFWSEPRATALEWGPCTGADEAGQELQFNVAAVSLADHRFLVFELDRDAAQKRDILQKARDQALRVETVATDLRSAASTIAAAVAELRSTRMHPAQEPLLQRLAGASEALLTRIADLAPPPDRTRTRSA